MTLRSYSLSLVKSGQLPSGQDEWGHAAVGTPACQSGVVAGTAVVFTSNKRMDLSNAVSDAGKVLLLSATTKVLACWYVHTHDMQTIPTSSLLKRILSDQDAQNCQPSQQGRDCTARIGVE
jgi:hypothetical protein